jgi:transcriptional regulator with XRE-family HTH domain
MLLAGVDSHPVLPFCHFELRAPKPNSTHYPKEINTLGDHIRSRRLNLSLFQSQVANKIGVHEMTITGWEGNATVPEVRYMPAIIQFLGYNPLPPANSLPERFTTARRALGMSQRKMAEKLGVDPATLMGWEAGRHQPTGKSLDLIAKVLEGRQNTIRRPWDSAFYQEREFIVSFLQCRSENRTYTADREIQESLQ